MTSKGPQQGCSPLEAPISNCFTSSVPNSAWHSTESPMQMGKYYRGGGEWSLGAEPGACRRQL